MKRYPRKNNELPTSIKIFVCGVFFYEIAVFVVCMLKVLGVF